MWRGLLARASLSWLAILPLLLCSHCTPKLSWKFICRRKRDDWWTVVTKQAKGARAYKRAAGACAISPPLPLTLLFPTLPACARLFSPSFPSRQTVRPGASHVRHVGSSKKKETLSERAPQSRSRPPQTQRQRPAERRERGIAARLKEKSARQEGKRQRQINRQKERARHSDSVLLLLPLFFYCCCCHQESCSERWDKAPRQTHDNNTSPCTSVLLLLRKCDSNGGAAVVCSASWWANCAPTRRRLKAWPCWTRWRRR